ncbi:unnamed protein product [Adineta ricciae]|uniref:Uncharacterized protein n=1 Tax=Adineta ricciae TaxID=249248 RepID=A0A815UQW9_ADIRI|nr:unnamed protein product [Adineta ricciae]
MGTITAVPWLPISCFDGNKNQNETDIDCSGPCATKCTINQTCAVNSDCANSNCHTTKHQCLAPSCDDGNLNQNETDVDCGGVCIGTCAVNQTCKINGDCANGNCPTAVKKCQPYSCFDGNKNQDEGDVDCGGPCNTTLCSYNNTCNVNSDCANGNCNLPSCNDGNKNQNETDIDCGGVCGANCQIDQNCTVNIDCANKNCHHTNLTCTVQVCDDGNKNQDETDIDCGGSTCGSTCIVGQACVYNSDCKNGNCNNTLKKCSDPVCNDGNKNQDETDADCGGATCSSRCGNGKNCTVTSDCATDNNVHETIQPISNLGIKKSEQRIDHLIIKSILAGILLSFSGLFLLTVGGGGGPIDQTLGVGIHRMVQAAVFPIGLIMIVTTGADLFTGNTMSLIISTLDRKTTLINLIVSWIVSYFGNLVGCLFFQYIFVYYAGLLSNEPYRSFTMKVAESKSTIEWHQILLRGIAGNWLVCLALWMGTSARELS